MKPTQDTGNNKDIAISNVKLGPQSLRTNMVDSGWNSKHLRKINPLKLKLQEFTIPLKSAIVRILNRDGLEVLNKMDAFDQLNKRKNILLLASAVGIDRELFGSDNEHRLLNLLDTTPVWNLSSSKQHDIWFQHNTRVLEMLYEHYIRVPETETQTIKNWHVLRMTDRMVVDQEYGK